MQEQNQLENILFLDIETVPQTYSYKVIDVKTKELFGHSNWHSLHKSIKKEIIRKMVNSNEFQNFRVGSKRL